MERYIYDLLLDLILLTGLTLDMLQDIHKCSIVFISHNYCTVGSKSLRPLDWDVPLTHLVIKVQMYEH